MYQKIFKMEGRAISYAIFILCSILLPLASADKLNSGFYNETCPQAEKIVAEVVFEAFRNDPSIAAGIARLLFHDCFVNGCDASILLDSTPSGEKIEKESPANRKSLRGLEVIDEAKARLEKACPEIVSCADTLVFAARESMVLSGVPHYQVPGGRRDSLVSHEKDVRGNLPPPTFPISKITELFTKKGMTLDEMVILLGAHSIGIAHCNTFAYRVQNYNATSAIDPKLNKEDIDNIKATCQKAGSTEEMAKISMPMDYATQYKMDNDFYKQLLQGKGVLESDRALTTDPGTRLIVQKMALDERRWLGRFPEAMSKLGEVDVKTGTEGEIRRSCRNVNSVNSRSGVGSGRNSVSIFDIPGHLLFSLHRLFGGG